MTLNPCGSLVFLRAGFYVDKKSSKLKKTASLVVNSYPGGICKYLTDADYGRLFGLVELQRNVGLTAGAGPASAAQAENIVSFSNHYVLFRMIVRSMRVRWSLIY